MCRAAGAPAVPIHAGPEHAIVGDTPQTEVPQAAVLERFDHRPADDFEASTAVTFLRDAILASPGEVTLLTIGPLTNAASSWARDQRGSTDSILEQHRSWSTDDLNLSLPGGRRVS